MQGERVVEGEQHNYEGDAAVNIGNESNHSILNSSLLSDCHTGDGSMELREEGSLCKETSLQGPVADLNCSILLSSKFELSLAEVNLDDWELSFSLNYGEEGRDLSDSLK